MTDNDKYFNRLCELTMSSWSNNYSDNDDPYNSRGDRITFDFNLDGGKNEFIKYLEKYKCAGLLYSMLSNEESRELLVYLMAFWAMGETKIKIPLDKEGYLEALTRPSNYKITDIPDPTITCGEYTLGCYDLADVGIRNRLYATPPGIGSVWFLRQYEYKSGTVKCKPEKGDIVIDCGGSWGDTPLYFADQVGDSGEVFVFEFIPSHLKAIHRNINLNPYLQNRINIIPNPVWSISGEKLYYVDWGPGSRLSSDPSRYNYDGTSITLSIDDLVHDKKIKKVDYIKMDIEGAELDALKGAERTILRDRPKLAISLYHSLEDFETIPNYLKSLGIGYTYYLGHYTLFENETVLYAVPKKQGLMQKAHQLLQLRYSLGKVVKFTKRSLSQNKDAQ